MQIQSFDALEILEDNVMKALISDDLSPASELKIESEFEMETSLAFWNQTLSALPLKEKELHCSLMPKSFESTSELEKVTTC